MKKKYIKLPKLNGQKVRKKYYISSTIQHPAKGNIPMMIWILERFVKNGEIILDPMAGIGTTLLEGMRLFPHSLFIGIELEYKFVKWANASIKKTERIARENWFMKIGKAICIQGDARDLQRVMKQKVDKIVSSPPFGGQVQHKTNYLGKQKRESGFEYSEDPENIGNLPQGNIDKIISSPPYGEGIGHGGGNQRKIVEEKKLSLHNKYPAEHKENIGNLSHGRIDKIVSSPPYERSVSPFMRGVPMPEDKGVHIGCRNIQNGYGRSKENIGNLPLGKVDKVISSPPYEDQMGRFKRKGKTQVMKDKKLYTYPDECEKTIGSLKGKTYLEAMFLVYVQCFKVLKPGGLMILITKDFIRKYKRVCLSEDTVKLCLMAGFKHIATHHRKITNPSFWRNDYYKKHPEVEQIDCEDVIILKK